MGSKIRKMSSVVGVLILAGALLPTFAGYASAHSDRESKLVGTWRIQIVPRDCQTGQAGPPFEALVSYADGGTLSDELNSPTFQPGQRATGLGVWAHTRRNSYKSVSEAFIQFDHPAIPVIKRGTQRLAWDLEVRSDRLSLESVGQFLDASGNVLATTCASGTGTPVGGIDDED